jgi:hypothetical protein
MYPDSGEPTGKFATSLAAFGFKDEIPKLLTQAKSALGTKNNPGMAELRASIVLNLSTSDPPRLSTRVVTPPVGAFSSTFFYE